MSVEVVILDDHPVYADGLIATLTREAPDITVVANATTWPDLDAQLGSLARTPDVALVDLHLADESGATTAIKELTAQGVRAVVITSEMRPIPVRRAMSAGAVGLALKSDPGPPIVGVVRAAARGEYAVSGALAFFLLNEPDLTAQLAPREVEVLTLLAEGVPRKVIGSRLNPPLSLSTVVTYINRACSRYRELGRDVEAPRDAVWRALEDGYLNIHPRHHSVADRRGAQPGDRGRSSPP